MNVNNIDNNIQIRKKNEKRAVIDIGSNSVRFMFARNDGGLNEKLLVSTRLGEGLAHTGVLSSAAMRRTADAVLEFTLKARNDGCTKIYAFATEAVRAASNGLDFVAQLKNECSLAVDVIDGSLEAEIGLLGCLDGSQSNAAVIDIGGASAEVICGLDGKIVYEKSLPLGMLRLIDLLGTDRNKIREYAQANVKTYGHVPRSEKTVGIGGTATSIGAMLTAKAIYEPTNVHGLCVTTADLNQLEQAVFTSGDVQKCFPVLSENRARIIGHGIILMSCILKHLGSDCFFVSEKDNMEGYLLKKDKNFIEK